jgi:hypothetical protein
MNTAKNTVTPLPPVRLRQTEMGLCGWLGQAEPGDVLQYHRGFLPIDRDAQQSRLGKQERDELIRMCGRALWAAERGFAHLLQRRHGECDYSYLIVARPRPKAVAATLLAALEQEAA